MSRKFDGFRSAAVILLSTALFGIPLSCGASICYGTVAKGRLSGGVKLPGHGRNFSAYSNIGARFGRTYVHATVRETIVDAYAALLAAAPGKQFVYGETGQVNGGAFPPHRTHQNGLSVDFMVPVLDSRGNSAQLPTAASDKFGYGLEFDSAGQLGGLRIDFEAMGEHLYRLDLASRRQGIRIRQVIFDRQLTDLLFQSKRGSYLKKLVPFMQGTPWIRHDEHYHVDFAIPCRPLATYNFSRR